MIDAWDIVLVAALALLGALLVVWGVRTLTAARRLRDVPKRSVADIAAGAVEVAGEIRAVGEPLRAIDGTPVVAMHTEIGYWFRDGIGRARHRSPRVVREACVPAELTDESGSCVLDPGYVALTGPSVESVLPAAEFRERHPDLWAHIRKKHADRVTSVQVAEWAVAHGARGSAAGEAAPDSTDAPGESYRSVKRRWKIAGRRGRPLLLCAGSESESRRYRLRPALLLMCTATLCFAAAGLLLASVFATARAAGL